MMPSYVCIVAEVRDNVFVTYLADHLRGHLYMFPAPESQHGLPPSLSGTTVMEEQLAFTRILAFTFRRWMSDERDENSFAWKQATEFAPDAYDDDYTIIKSLVDVGLAADAPI